MTSSDWICRCVDLIGQSIPGRKRKHLGVPHRMLFKLLLSFAVLFRTTIASAKYSGPGCLLELDLVKAASQGQAGILKLYLPFADPKPLDPAESITFTTPLGALEEFSMKEFRNWYDVALAGAIFNGQERCVSLLLDSGYAIPETETGRLFEFAFKSGYHRIGLRLLEYDWSLDSLKNVLFESCKKGDLEAVKNLLKIRSSYDSADWNTAITHAVEYGHDDIVGILLENDALPNSIAFFQEASISPSVLRLIIEKGFDVMPDGLVSLYIFLLKNNLEQAKILMEAGIDPSTFHHNDFLSLIIFGRLDAMKLVIDGDYFSATFKKLFKLACSGECDELKHLVENNSFSLSELDVALLSSVASGNIQAFHFLAEKAKSLGSTALSSNTISTASEFGQLEVMNAIIESGLCDPVVQKMFLAVINEDDSIAAEFAENVNDNMLNVILIAAVDLRKFDFFKRNLEKYIEKITPNILKLIHKKAVAKKIPEVSEYLKSLGFVYPEEIKETAPPTVYPSISVFSNVMLAMDSLIFMDYSDSAEVHEQHMKSRLMMSKAILTLKSNGYESMAEIVRRLQDGLTTIRALRELGLPPDLVEQKFKLLVGKE